MEIHRRAVIKLLAGGVVALLQPGARRAHAANASLALRTVTAADATNLQAIMNASVTGSTAFFGPCGEWSLDWATDFLRNRPYSVLITLNTLPVALVEVPTIRPELPALKADASDADKEKYRLGEQNRTTFRLAAAGVRSDRLSATDAVAMFRRALYYGFRAARRQGFVRGEARVPWEQAQLMQRKWTDYPSCELVEAPSRAQEKGGQDWYWLRWQLDDVISALAAEGAGVEALDVA